MNLKNIFLPILVVSMLLVSGCDGYLDINDNPNVATEPPIDGLLANASLNTGLNQFRISNSFSAFFVQYLASPNESSTTDIYLEASYSGSWGSIYDAMTNLSDLIKFGTEIGSDDHVGVAKVLMAMNLGLIIDNWGDAPYSDGFTGATLTPMYDDDAQLYQTIFQLLDEAERDLANSDNLPEIDGSSDFVHGGDLEAWGKTIEALRARYLNHLSATSDYNPNAVLTAVDAAYSSFADDAAVSTFQVRNPWAQVAIDNDNLFLGGWISEQFIDAMNGTTYGVFDPRLPYITNENVDGEYIGTVNGAGRTGDGTEADESYLEETASVSSPDSPLDIITFTELKFIEAEAALAANNPDRAVSAFRAGVTASIVEIATFQGVDPVGAEATATNYLDEAYPGLSAATLTIDMIFREKYVALFLSPETWVDARRYNYQYADFDLPQNAALSQSPLRVQYPNTELDRNGRNTPIVTLIDPIFWDQ